MELRTTVFDTVPSLDSLRAFWQSKQAHPLVDFDFFTLICQVRAKTTRPCVIAVWRGLELIALIVGRSETIAKRLGIGYAQVATLKLQHLRFISGGFIGEQSTSIINAALAQVAEYMQVKRIACAAFEGLQPESLTHRVVGEAVRPWRIAFLDGTAKHWTLDLPQSWDEFMRQRQTKHRYWINRLARTLDRDFPGRWSIETYREAHEVDVFLEAAEQVASTAYHRAMNVGFRYDEEYTQRVQLEARVGRLRGYVLRIDARAAAFWYCAAYRGTVHLIATAFDPRYGKYEPGTLLLMSVFREHCGSAEARVDFGLGDAAYKQRFGTDSVVEGTLYFFAATLRGVALRAVFGAFRLLNDSGARLLQHFDLTQRVKTLWKRRLREQAP